MKISTQKLSWMSISFVVALLAGSPVWADDTELLLINPDPTQNPKPNVLFILDTSGSMNTTQTTIEPYDATQTYGGDCDPDAHYWTDVDILPDCATTDNVINPGFFVCEFAQNQLDGIGSFTNTMVQYRGAGVFGFLNFWQNLAPNTPDAWVECQADSGDHGQATGDPEVYAAAGVNLPNPWTADPAQNLGWGSPPRNISYTVYTGNYLNWKDSPNNVVLSRSDIMKEVAKKVLSSVNNLNVGLMRFSGGNGGAIILDIQDLDTNRQDILDEIDALPAGGVTPLSETLYESALYWRGMASEYDSNLTDPNTLASTSPSVYEHPEWDICAKNYTVLLTDGAPVSDGDTPGLVGNLPGFPGGGCDGAGAGLCLDDIAEYLSLVDVDTDPADPTADGDQLVTTHTIGFTIDLPILKETAENSGGQYFLADDVESLTKTLLSIIANINDRSLSFSAPAVSVNTFNRTQNLNDVYITTFGAKTRAHWPGNLKKYRVLDGEIVDVNDVNAVDPTTGFFLETARSYWTSGGADGNDVRLGGAAQQLPDPSVRKLYTNNTSGNLTDGTNSVSVGNIAAFVEADFGLTGAPGEPDFEDLIDWARGEDIRDEDNNLATTVRKTMGDPLHSQPAAVVYGGTAENPDVVVYTATNDGYLHAIDGDTGQELWAFIPKQLLKNLMRLYFDPSSNYKQYGLDGNIVSVVKDVDEDGIIEPGDGDFVQLLLGMRRGGSTLFSLDVTDRNNPVLLWSNSLAGFGETWSTPVVARVDVGGTVAQNTDNAVVIVGGGYDVVHDTAAHPLAGDGFGASVHMMDLKSGAELWRASADPTADLTLDVTGREMDRAIPNQVRVIDFSGDGFADRMYATDLGGQIWRFDVFNGKDVDELVTGGVIAQLGAEGLAVPGAADTRRFYNAPDVSLVTDQYQQRRYVAISVGTGYRAHPFDLSAADRFFSVRDGDVFNQLDQNAYDNYDIVEDGDLVEVSGQTQTVITAADRGWKFTLPANEKVLADSLTFDDEIFFVSFTPDSSSAATCSAGKGTNFLYRMSAINGDPVVANISTLDPNLADGERRQALEQGGIAPSPTILFPSPETNCTGDDCIIPPLMCVGVECSPPGFDPFPVRTLWTQDGIQ
ncbi:MAG: PilC/PilY family type IV pilus protein [Pseudomonadota bacterium]